MTCRLRDRNSLFKCSRWPKVVKNCYRYDIFDNYCQMVIHLAWAEVTSFYEYCRVINSAFSDEK